MSKAIKTTPDFSNGLSLLGIPDKEVCKISTFLRHGRIPTTVLISIMKNEPGVTAVHPDKFPWESWVYDEISKGLRNEINTDIVYDSTQEHVKRIYGRDLPHTSLDTEGTSGAITNLMEMYALARFHDLDAL